ncbi:MAG: hypothetical protein DIU71_06805 [Proteobacteria bacterium]|nr:MAG: hypothetical protein DIU71_06805 [Pseudomonadota bacterium]
MSCRSASILYVELAGRRFAADLQGAHDLSIPLRFDAEQPRFFAAPPASAHPLQAGAFIGAVARGGSCNCATYTLTPHCNGTHTECVGHITRTPLSVREAAGEHLVIALLVSVAPQRARDTDERSQPAPHPDDWLITRAALQDGVRAALESSGLAGVRPSQAAPDCPGLIVRTLPNPVDKQWRDHDAALPPYFSAAAIAWLVAGGVRHLVVDLPSVDRAHDEGRLHGHRLFWGAPPGEVDASHATRSNATITELAYIDAAIPDGLYLLNLQVAPFVADAAPSRPVIFPLHEA